MENYLELKFKNDLNDKVTVRVTDFKTDATDSEIKIAMQNIAQAKVFEGKNGAIDTAVEANRIVINTTPVVIE